LNTAKDYMPENSVLDIALLHEIPLYNADIEDTTGIPRAIDSLKELIVSSDGLLLSTPEYNSSIPGVFKNAIDWLSRPPDDIKRVFADKPVGLMGASTGSFGTMLSQVSWLQILRALGVKPYFGSTLYVSRSADIFDELGYLNDEVTLGRLQNYLLGFLEFVTESGQ
jgi:NAD(P)H-dependent FMN reductase